MARASETSSSAAPRMAAHSANRMYRCPPQGCRGVSVDEPSVTSVTVEA